MKRIGRRRCLAVNYVLQEMPSGAKIDDVAHQHFQAEHINGLLVFISNKPKQIAVRAGAKTAQLFGKEQRGELRQTFILVSKTGSRAGIIILRNKK